MAAKAASVTPLPPLASLPPFSRPDLRSRSDVEQPHRTPVAYRDLDCTPRTWKGHQCSGRDVRECAPQRTHVRSCHSNVRSRLQGAWGNVRDQGSETIDVEDFTHHSGSLRCWDR